MAQGAITLDEAARQARVEDEQRRRGAHGTNDQHATPHLPCDDALVTWSRRPLHQSGIGRLEPEGERRSTIGREVDPQQLRRQERKGDSASGRSPEADPVGEHDAEEHGHDLTDVGRQEVPEKLADVLVDRSPLLDCTDDRREVVVCEHDVGRFLRDVGPGDSHRDADVRRLERGGVVDSVPGHRDDIAPSLQRLDDPQLVLGVDACVNGDLANDAVEHLIGHPGDLRAADGACTAGGDPELLGDHRSGPRMVAGDHDRADACGSRAGDGGPGLLTRRVDHPDQSEEDQILLDAIVEVLRAERVPRQRAVGHRDGPQGLPGELVDHLADPGPPPGIERFALLADELS